jgi:phenylacetate-CoA ligase
VETGTATILFGGADFSREAGPWRPWSELLAHWRQIPLYRQRLEHALQPGRTDAGPLPFLTKRDMREGFPGNFLPSQATLNALLEQNEIELEYTSGTSEERTPVIFRRGWWDEQELRALRLNPQVAAALDGLPEARRATLTTPACNGRSCPVVWQSAAQRTFGRTRFVNLARIPFTLPDSELQRMAREIAEWEPVFLDLAPTHGVRFALYCEQHGLRFPSLRFILASYEFVSTVHRRILERVFGVPVYNLYGSTETGHLLMQSAAPDGTLRGCTENALLEVVDLDAQGVGDLVVTTLTNEYMPLLRYRIGDLVERTGQGASAGWRLHGRVRDALRRRDGQRVTTGQVDQCFSGAPGLAHYQLSQSVNGQLHLRYLPDPAATADLRPVVDQLTALLQPASPVEIESAPVLLPAHSGKFRLTCPA